MKFFSWRLLLGVIGLVYLNIIGAIIGFVIGYVMDKGTPSGRSEEENKIVYGVFLSVIGFAIKKQEGTISEDNIYKIRRLIQGSSFLDFDTSVEKIRYCESPDFSLSNLYKTINRHFRSRSQSSNIINHLVIFFVEFYQGKIPSSIYTVILDIARLLNISKSSVDINIKNIISLYNIRNGNYSYGGSSGGYRDDSRYNDGYYQSGGSNSGSTSNNVMTLFKAKRILNLELSNYSEQDLKRAYRKLIQTEHPDKVVQGDMTDEQFKKAKEQAEEKTKDINNAMEYLKKQHGWK